VSRVKEFPTSRPSTPPPSTQDGSRNGRGLSRGGGNAAEALAHKVQGGSFASSAAAVQGGGLDTLSVAAIPLLP